MITRHPGPNDDAELNAQVRGGLLTLAIVCAFLGGIAFGLYLASPA